MSVTTRILSAKGRLLSYSGAGMLNGGNVKEMSFAIKDRGKLSIGQLTYVFCKGQITVI